MAFFSIHSMVTVVALALWQDGYVEKVCCSTGKCHCASGSVPLNLLVTKYCANTLVLKLCFPSHAVSTEQAVRCLQFICKQMMQQGLSIEAMCVLQYLQLPLS